MDINQRSAFIKQTASTFGFSATGIAKASFMEEEARRLEQWLHSGFHGEMAYMANHFDLRVDPTKLVPGAKSVICLAYNYFPNKNQVDPRAPKIAKYAYGKDYHKVLRKKLLALVQTLQLTLGTFDFRVFVDSAPILERDWAKRSGLGWIGKNTLLLQKSMGSYFFLAEIVCDLELSYDQPSLDYCGTCTRCITACPTDAIAPQGYVLDGSKCISYLTIEKKGDIPTSFQGKMENWVFGCDICQDVCPWNRFAQTHQEPAFEPHPDLLSLSNDQWNDLSEDTFNTLFEGSAVKRTKYEGLRRNINFLDLADLE